jgi:hypothetical protein
MSSASTSETVESEPITERLSVQVANATKHLIAALQADEWKCTHCEQPVACPRDDDGFVSAGKLKAEGRRRSGEASTIVNIAFWGLVNSGRLEEDPNHHLTFRLKASDE